MFHFNSIVYAHQDHKLYSLIYLHNNNNVQVQAANILFVDNPVGTGYSYVDDLKYLTKDIKEITEDLVTLIRAFLKKYSVFEVSPCSIFCEGSDQFVHVYIFVKLFWHWIKGYWLVSVGSNYKFAHRIMM